MNMRVGLDARAFRSAMRKASPELKALASKVVEGTGLELQGDIKKRILRGPKTGTTYYRIPGENYMTIRAGSPNGTPVAFIPGGGAANLSPVHTASAPGQSPAKDTGGLARSVMFDREGDLKAVVTFKGGKKGSSYNAIATYLEWGTRKIAQRPFIRPAIEEARPKFQSRMEKAILANLGVFGRAKFKVEKALKL